MEIRGTRQGKAAADIEDMKRALLLALPLLSACSSTSKVASDISEFFDITPYIHPYRIDVRQGNMVTQEMVSQLKPGQTRDQVRFILGTPLLTDIFHADRWDYVYRLKTGKGEIQQRRLVVFFENDKLVRVGGDVVGEDPNDVAPPKPAARVVEIAAPAPAKEAAKPAEKAEEKTEDAKPEDQAASK